MESKIRKILPLFYISIIVFILSTVLMLYYNKYNFYIDKDNIKLDANENYTLDIVSKNGNYYDYDNYEFKSSNNDILTVSSEGIITPKSNGTAEVIVKSKKGFVTRKVKVTIDNIVVSSIEQNDIVLDETSTTKLNPVINGDEKISKDLTYKVEDENIVEVDEKGNIKPISKGTTSVTISDSNGVSKTVEVTVGDKVIDVKSIKLSKTSITVYIGEVVTIETFISPTDATNKNVLWSSLDTSIATVSNGIVTCKKIGVTTITATTSNGLKATCKINVINEEKPKDEKPSEEKPTNSDSKPVSPSTEVKPTSIKLDKNTASVSIGSALTLNATVLPSDATNKNVTWSSLDTSIATVSNGIVKGIKVGTVTITATTSNGIKATCNVTVKEVVASSISINDSSLSIDSGASAILKATILPDNTTNKVVTWSSSNTGIATVDSTGKVTSIKAGTVTITATTSNGLKATCTVTVKEPVVSSKEYNAIFIGNSKTYKEKIPVQVAKFAKKDNIDLTVKYFTDTGGKTLETIAENKNEVIRLKYDIAVLQEQTDAYIENDCSTYKSGVEKIVGYLRETNPNIKIYIRKTWVKKGSKEGTIIRGYSCTDSIASEYNLKIINDGPALYYANDVLGVTTFDTDGSETGNHPNRHGGYLTAACIYATVFDKDPVGSEYKGMYTNPLTYYSKVQNAANKYCYRNNTVISNSKY